MNTPLPKRKHLQRIPVWLPLNQPVIYLLTVCCAERQQLFVCSATVKTAVGCLRRTETRHAWQVTHVCFMPDHVHLLLSPTKEREQVLSDFVRAWKSCVTLRLKQGNIWQREFHDRLLRSDEKADVKWAYIRENPVRAGLCVAPEDYPYTGSPSEILRRLDDLNPNM
jgi:REP element-mobilizing transposase RayT